MSERQPNVSEPEIDRALAEYLNQCDSGSELDRESFLSRYSPDLRAQLAELLSVADWVENLASPIGSDRHAAADKMESSHLSFLEGNHPTDPLSETMPLGTQRFSNSASSISQFASHSLPCRFGDYELQRVLGRGGMGVVYYAKQLQLDRPVAIKMIRSGALASEEEVQRFYTEARSAARLSHPRIVRVYQCGQQDDHHFFSMDYIDGTDLDKLAKQSRMDPKAAARYVRDAAEAIQFAHDQGIVHRDLKPANILIDEKDEVHITDFGLAKNVGKQNGLTATGAAVGTPSYMSPEQAAGRLEDQGQATDVYSLGAILYAILVGEPPFKSENVLQTLMHVIHRPAPRVRALRKDVPEDLETVVDVCLQKSPNKRYASAAELALDLDRFIRGLPITARPISGFRRACYWLLGIPVVGAVLDNRVIEPTNTHRWVQRGMITAGSLMLVAWLMMFVSTSVWVTNRMPRAIRVAAGAEGGQYDQIAKALANVLSSRAESKVELFPSEGSSENLELLATGNAHLALLQADVVEESKVSVIAPLYYEVVHLLIREDLNLTQIQDLKGRQVFLGREKAGTRVTAKRLLSHFGLSLDDVKVVESEWKQAVASGEFEAAILVMRAGAPEIMDILKEGRYRLISLPQAWEFALREPSFHFIYVGKQDYPDSQLDEQAISTIAATAYLVCQPTAPDVLVNEVLNALYTPELMQMGVLTADQAAHWQGIAWHPAARAFFRAYRGDEVH